MRVTIIAGGVVSEYGIPFAINSIQSVSQEYGESLVASLKALDTDGVIGSTDNQPFDANNRMLIDIDTLVAQATQDVFIQAGTWLMDPISKAVYGQSDGIGGYYAVGGLISYEAQALEAWVRQPKTYKLAAIPAYTHYVNSVSGNDGNAGTSDTTPWQTLTKVRDMALPAGSCIALSNNSLFDLTDRITFSGATAVNGTSESNRWTLTNYDPGGYPTQRPRVRFRYLPTSVQWTQVGTTAVWFYNNPNGRTWTKDALVRFPDRNRWGINMAGNGVLADVVAPYQCFSSGIAMYVYASTTQNPTVYYGGATGSVVLGEGEGAALSFSRCAKYVTIDNTVFEECGNAINHTNYGAVESLDNFVIQRCVGLNCGTFYNSVTDSNSAFNIGARIFENVLVGFGGVCLHTFSKAKNYQIAGNYARDMNQSHSQGGWVYTQEGVGGAVPSANQVYQNYIENALFNIGANAGFDGAGVYLEQRSGGWEIYSNFFKSMHAGIITNTTLANKIHHNVFDDVDILAEIGDASSTNVTIEFVHNTGVKIGLDKYRNGSINDTVTAAVGTYSNVISGTIDVRNNVFQFSKPGAAVRTRAGLVINADSNHIGNGTGVVTTDNGATFLAVPADTQTGVISFDTKYKPGSMVTAGVALTNYPNPVDINNFRAISPVKGAVAGGYIKG